MSDAADDVEVGGGPDAPAAAALFDMCSNLLAVADFRGRLVVANPSWHETLGHRVEDVVGRRMTDFIHPDDVGSTTLAFDAALDLARTATVVTSAPDVENRLVAADGSVRRMSWTVRVDPGLRRVYAVGHDLTEARKIERALAAATDESAVLAARLQSTLASIGDGFLAVDRAGRCTYINPGAERLLNVRADRVLGRRLGDLRPESEGMDYRREWDEALETQTARVIKHRSRQTGRWLEINLSPWPDGMSAHFRDVTLREEALRRRDEYEQQLQAQAALLHTAHEAMLATDDRGVVTFWNPAAERMYGWSAAEAIGRELRTLVLPAGEDYDSSALDAVVAHGAWSGRIVHATRDGRRIPVEVTTWVSRDERRQTAFTVISDITERVELEERLHDALDVAGMAAWDYDVAADRIWREEQLDRLFGIGVDGTPPEQFMAQPWTRARFLSYVVPDDLPTLLDVERDAIATGRFRAEFRVRWADGSVHWLGISGGTRHDAAGRPVRGVGTLVDITERKRLEEERALLDQQLAQARKMEAVGRLAGGVAHDFNNLLTVINGYTELALHRATDPLTREQLEAVALAGTRAAELTQQLLTLSRRQQVTFRPVDLNAVVADAQRLLTRLIGDHIEVVTRLTPGLEPVLGDPGQLSQVIINLAVNARDAMAGGGTLTIETAAAEPEAASRTPDLPPGTFVRLSMCDTGHGMDAETLARAFEPFFTTKPTGQGTGLGLSTVYGIVERCGGHVHVHSAPGDGTAFDVYLPVGASAAEQEPDVSTRPVAQRSEHVLLVEDDRSVRALVTDMLGLLGYSVTVADGPLAALDAPTDDVDLVLTDVLMPSMNGRELFDRLRERPRPQGRRPLRVVYMSGFASTVINEQFPLEEHQGFLQKPFTLDDLRERLHIELTDARG